MTLIAVHSDIHMENGGPFDIKLDPQTDMLILAGDIGARATAPKIIRKSIGDKDLPIIYVAGNHEFYLGEYSWVLEDLKTECRKYGIMFLNNEIAQLGNVYVAGTTLWTNFELDGNAVLAEIECKRFINDFTHIKYRNALLTTEVVKSLHKKSCDFLNLTSRMSNSFAKTDTFIVVSHFAPHPLCRQKRINGCDPYFYTDCREIFHNIHPHMWIHGHTHVNTDFQYMNTRVISNQGEQRAIDFHVEIE